MNIMLFCHQVVMSSSSFILWWMIINHYAPRLVIISSFPHWPGWVYCHHFLMTLQCIDEKLVNNILFAIISSFIILIMTMIHWVLKNIYTTKNRSTWTQYFLSYLIENISSTMIHWTVKSDWLSLMMSANHVGCIDIFRSKRDNRSLKKLHLYNIVWINVN